MSLDDLTKLMTATGSQDPSNGRISGVWCRKVGTTEWTVIMLSECLRCDPGRRLFAQVDLEPLKQQRLIPFRFGVTREYHGAAVSRWQMQIDHLDRRHLVQH